MLAYGKFILKINFDKVLFDFVCVCVCKAFDNLFPLNCEQVRWHTKKSGSNHSVNWEQNTHQYIWGKKKMEGNFQLWWMIRPSVINVATTKQAVTLIQVGA